MLYLVAAVGILTGVMGAGEQAPSAFDSEKENAPSIETPSAPPIFTPKEEEAHARAVLRREVCQLMLVALEGTQGPSAADSTLLQSYTPAGVVIPRLLHPGAAEAYLTRLAQVTGGDGTRLLVAADLSGLVDPERGMGRLSGGHIPSMLAVAATGSRQAAEDLARIWAEYLSVMGFNMCLGPHLSLASTLPEAKGSLLCAGSDPAFTAEVGAAWCEVLAEHHLLAVPMGFPGGEWDRTEGAPAVLATPQALLAERDLRPYAEAVEKGARVVHVGTTLVPLLDKDRLPACLSPAVIRDLLRQGLGFEGVVLAGPLDGGAIEGRFDVAEAAIRALEAGADLLYVAGGPGPAKRVADHIVTAVEEGRLERAVISEAEARVSGLRSYLAEAEPASLKSGRMSALPSRRDLNELSESIQRRALTVAQNRGGVLPLTKERSMPVGVTGVVGVVELQGSLEKHLKRVSRQRIMSARHLGDIETFEIRRITDQISGGTVVCVLDSAMRTEGAAALIRGLKARGTRVVLVLLGYPRNLEAYMAADALMLTYAPAEPADSFWVSVADALTGRGALGLVAKDAALEFNAGEARTFDIQSIVMSPGGRLPVSISKSFPAGTWAKGAGEVVWKSVEWEFGDGNHAKGSPVTYAYPAPGQYNMRVQVTGQDGLDASQEYAVEVTSAAP